MSNLDSSKVHKGPIHSNVAGRTDHLPMHVENGSYVIPADIISAMGEGNSMAGFKVARSIFGLPPFWKTRDNSENSKTPPVAIVAAGGEYVITPQEVERIGKGDLDFGHKILSAFVTNFRKKTIKTLSNLPGPK